MFLSKRLQQPPSKKTDELTARQPGRPTSSVVAFKLGFGFLLLPAAPAAHAARSGLIHCNASSSPLWSCPDRPSTSEYTRPGQGTFQAGLAVIGGSSGPALEWHTSKCGKEGKSRHGKARTLQQNHRTHLGSESAICLPAAVAFLFACGLAWTPSAISFSASIFAWQGAPKTVSPRFQGTIGKVDAFAEHTCNQLVICSPIQRSEGPTKSSMIPMQCFLQHPKCNLSNGLT